MNNIYLLRHEERYNFPGFYTSLTNRGISQQEPKTDLRYDIYRK